MSEKKRPPRFDDIVALSHQPPRKKMAVSPFTLAYDAEEARKLAALPQPDELPKSGLRRIEAADLPALPEPDVGSQSTHVSTHVVGSLSTQSTQGTHDSLGTQATQTGLQSMLPEDSGKGTRKDTREQLNLKLSRDLLERLRRYAFDNRSSVKDVVVTALEHLLGTQGRLGTLGSLGAQGRKVPTLDNDIDDDDQTLIDLYEQAAGRAFNERDRDFLRQYRHFGRDCLALAIVLGRNRSRQPINSMRFFENIVKEVAAWQPDKIERELQFQMISFRRRVKYHGRP